MPAAEPQLLLQILPPAVSKSLPSSMDGLILEKMNLKDENPHLHQLQGISMGGNGQERKKIEDALKKVREMKRDGGYS